VFETCFRPKSFGEPDHSMIVRTINISVAWHSHVRLRSTVSFTQKDLVFLGHEKEWTRRLTLTQIVYAANTKWIQVKS
jgi:hypothetical protein